MCPLEPIILTHTHFSTRPSDDAYEKDSKRFPKTGGWGYAVFNYDAASNKFTADPNSLADCGQSCHVAVKAKDYIFHPYQKR